MNPWNALIVELCDMKTWGGQAIGRHANNIIFGWHVAQGMLRALNSWQATHQLRERAVRSISFATCRAVCF